MQNYVSFTLSVHFSERELTLEERESILAAGHSQHLARASRSFSGLCISINSHLPTSIFFFSAGLFCKLLASWDLGKVQNYQPSEGLQAWSLVVGLKVCPRQRFTSPLDACQLPCASSASFSCFTQSFLVSDAQFASTRDADLLLLWSRSVWNISASVDRKYYKGETAGN